MYVMVNVEQGILRGQEKISSFFSYKQYYSFQGISYAKPPLGSLRFKDPEEPEQWTGVRDALKEGNDCIQSHVLFSPQPTGNEDCLYLNVYTSEIGGTGRPVIVSIHGGGFNLGSGSTYIYGPDYLMEQDVVLVTVNYRIGPLGFLCLDHKEVPGNAGLKDQVMALKWIQRNIAKFSGNPNNVTICGISAGGASVHYHLMSPLSKGLFHRAIIQSGCAFNPWAYNNRDNAIDRAFRLGKQLGCDTKDTNMLLQFLRQVPAINLPRASGKIFCKDETAHNLLMPFVPCLEVPATSNSFLPASPRQLLRQGHFIKVPTIIGSTNAEGILYALYFGSDEEALVKEDKRFEKFVPPDMGLPYGSNKCTQAAKEIKKAYFGDKPLTIDMFNEYVAIHGDILFDAGIDEALRLQLESTDTPVYAYEFTFEISQSCCKSLLLLKFPSIISFEGVAHGDDMSYFFCHYIEDLSKPTTEEEKFIKKMCRTWATFAKTGNPNNEELETKWEPVTKSNFCHLEIGSKLKMCKGRVKEHRMQIWQRLYDKYPKVF